MFLFFFTFAQAFEVGF